MSLRSRLGVETECVQTALNMRHVRVKVQLHAFFNALCHGYAAHSSVPTPTLRRRQLAETPRS
jgi:hypothetical protein